MTKLLTDDELNGMYHKQNWLKHGSWDYERAIEAAVIAKLGGTLLSDYVEKAIIEDRRKWRALIGEPSAWLVNKKDSEHQIMFLHYPADAIADSARYVEPLHKIPKELK